MTAKELGEQHAFPNSGSCGLTKREYFAVLAMQGLRASRLIENEKYDTLIFPATLWDCSKIAKLAVADADTLLYELAKPTPPKAEGEE